MENCIIVQNGVGKGKYDKGEIALDDLVPSVERLNKGGVVLRCRAGIAAI